MVELDPRDDDDVALGASPVGGEQYAAGDPVRAGELRFQSPFHLSRLRVAAVTRALETQQRGGVLITDAPLRIGGDDPSAPVCGDSGPLATLPGLPAPSCADRPDRDRGRFWRVPSRPAGAEASLDGHILDAIPLAIVVLNSSLRVARANRHFLENAGRDPRRVVGRRIQDIFSPELVEVVRLHAKIHEVFGSGQVMSGGKLTSRSPGRPERYYAYSLVPLKSGTTVHHVMLLLEDITERWRLEAEVHQTERHLASVIACATDLVVAMDRQGRITTWNRAAETLSGFGADEAKTTCLFDFCSAGHRESMIEMVERAVSGDTVQDVEMPLLTRAGEEVPVAWNCAPMSNHHGRVTGIVAVGRDLRDRRRAEAQLIQSAKMAALGMMAAGIAHELRNPLAVVSAAAQLLLEQPENAGLRQQGLQKLRASIARAASIIEDLLNFARPEHGRREALSVHDLLDEALALLRHQADLQQVRVTTALEPGLPQIRGNRNLLVQVFTNIILNACHAMPQGGTLAITTTGRDDAWVEIVFADTGRGIPPEHLPKVFDPFFTTMPAGKGTGLGLSICYTIVRQHDGVIEVESRVNRGTTVIIRLPIKTPGAHG